MVPCPSSLRVPILLLQVHLLVRSGKMRASAAMQDRVLGHEKVEVHYNTAVSDAYGDKKGMKGLLLKDRNTGEGAAEWLLD